MLLFIFLANCSFDKKTGIWSSEKDEKRRALDIEKQQKSVLKTVQLYSSENNYTLEIKAKNKENETSDEWKPPELGSESLARNDKSCSLPVIPNPRQSAASR